MPKIVCFAAIAFLVPACAFAQDSFRNTSAVAGHSGETVAMLGETGIKAVAGVVALPLGIAGLGMAGAGSVAAAPGQALTAAGGGLSEAADDIRDFAGKPLKVSEEVVFAPQPAPIVPFKVQGQN